MKSYILTLKIGIVFSCLFLAILTWKPKIAILYIATGSYITFWDDFYQNMEEKFLPDMPKTYFVFTDDTSKTFPRNVVKIHQKKLPWPQITLMRFHFFQKIETALKNYDYIYFLNANMMPIQKVGSEILPTPDQGIVVTQHPGYYKQRNPDYFTYDRNPESKAYIPYGKGRYYVAGGFNGGTQKAFMQLINDLVKWTDEDLKKGIIPVFHDESYLNRYLIDYMLTKEPIVLSQRYASAVEYGMYDGVMIVLPKDQYGVHRYYKE